MAHLHKNIDHVFELTEDTPVPLGLRRSTSRYTEMQKFATFLPWSLQLIWQSVAEAFLGVRPV